MSYILDRSRIGLAAALGLATLFALAPIAQAAPRAQVPTSYVQDYVATVDGETTPATPDSATLSCAGGIVTDAYYSIQAVDGGKYGDVTVTVPTIVANDTAAKTFTYRYVDSSDTAEERENSRAQIRLSLSCVPTADSIGAPISFTPGAPLTGPNFGFTNPIVSGGYERKLMLRNVTTSVDLSTLGAGEVREFQVTCPDPPAKLYDYNAVADNGSSTNTPSMRIVGVEPAGNDMTFRVINEFTAAIPAAALSSNVVCLRQSTTKGKKV